ncbi:hypothetical protein P353_08205 [Comamonas testosteroni]|uniref:Uncharacterized protein n=1 Tax=Comamonas testosteroni TaxID=285 RepID=A0A096FM32_COMTE|nr:hypothetical protein P353_08205 [Comamonas testosteroni]
MDCVFAYENARYPSARVNTLDDLTKERWLGQDEAQQCGRCNDGCSGSCGREHQGGDVGEE